MNQFLKSKAMPAGFSGAKSHIDFDGKLFKKYDYRSAETLQYQKQVQEKLFSFFRGVLRTPRIINFDENDNVSILTMEYIYGQTLYEVFESGEHQLAFLALIKLWDEWSKVSIEGSYFEETYQAEENRRNYLTKLHRIKKYADILNLSNKKLFKLLLNEVWDINILNSKARFCHGDMNFENIILSGDYIYLYDFIKSPFPCLEQDVSKIIQDGIGGWCFRKSPSFDSFEQYIVTRNVVLKIFSDTEINKSLVKQQSYLSCLRIIPYIRDESDSLAWLRVAKNINNFFEEQL
jgi:hypothetical protein